MSKAPLTSVARPDATPLAREALLEWGVRHHRELPWRRTRDPWAVLVAEVMLHQTQVERVTDRWTALMARWPRVTDWAALSLADLLVAWQGLGYPRRARNLQAAARFIAERYDGVVPRTVTELTSLPGVGPYTARAVLAFAFEETVGVVDTNVGRILARREGRPLGRTEAQDLADGWVPEGRGWEWNQAMMDLGATLCRPRAPGCAECPWLPGCGWAGGAGGGPDPATGSAGVSTPQRPYRGSDRELRGRLLRALAEGPVSAREVAAVLEVSRERAEAVARSLEADGLVSVAAEWMALPSG